MTTSIIRAGGTGVPGVQTTGGDDGALALKVGPLAATVEALNISSTGTGAFVGQVTATGFTGTLDGILGSGTPAAATVTTFTSNGIDDNADAVAITIDSSENVGIGTASPSTPLHVNGAITVGQINAASGSKIYTVGSGTYELDIAGALTLSSGRDNGASMLFEVSNSEKMRIDAAGIVGIGTTVPYTTTKLNVAGATSTNTTSFAAANPPAAGQLDIRSTDAFGTQLGGKLTFSGISGTDGGFAGKAVYGAIQGYKTNATINNSGGGLILSTTVNATGVLTERMRILGDNGNVGIGTAAPIRKLHVVGDRSLFSANSEKFAVGARYIDSGGTVYFGATDATSTPGVQISAATGAALLNILTGGNVGIGTAAPASILHVQGADPNLIIQDTNNTGDAFIRFKNNSGTQRSFIQTAMTANVMLFGTGTAEAMRIDASGNLLVNRSTQVQAGQYSADFPGTSKRGATYNNTESFNGSNFVSFSDQGTIVGTIVQNTASTVNFSTSSDYRLKENVIYDWDATTRLKQLKPARFNFITDDDTVDGFLAHEAATVVPEAVTGIKDEVDDEGKPVMQGIDQGKLVPLLVKTILELEARITALEG